MFSHRGLFLAVTISLASIAHAGVLVQPGYELQYVSNPRYSASTKSSKSEIIAHDNDVAAKSFLIDAKHPTTIDSLFLADTTDKLLEKCQAVTNHLVSSVLPNLSHPPTFDHSRLFREIKLPESELSDTTDKRLAYCRSVNNFILFHIQLRLKGLLDISSGHQTFEYIYNNTYSPIPGFSS